MCLCTQFLIWQIQVALHFCHKHCVIVIIPLLGRIYSFLFLPHCLVFLPSIDRINIAPMIGLRGLVVCILLFYFGAVSSEIQNSLAAENVDDASKRLRGNSAVDGDSPNSVQNVGPPRNPGDNIKLAGTGPAAGLIWVYARQNTDCATSKFFFQTTPPSVSFFLRPRNTSQVSSRSRLL
jgi:hypothetical protein